jgi:phosphoribosylglycinamide formyltransferase 2
MIKPNDSLGKLKIMLLGCGELGKEVILEAQRLGIQTVAVDRYFGAPGHQVAHKFYSINMKDAGALRSVVEKEKPDAIIPEIEAINLDTLMDLEREGYFVVPRASATHAAMHRKRIRELIAKKANVPTSKYVYTRTDDLKEFKAAVEKIGYPCHAKAIMSSSGHGSYFVKSSKDLEKALKEVKTRARGSGDEAIIEEHIPFSTEVTELAVRHYDTSGKIVTTFPYPVGHVQVEGDYHASWQSPEVMDYLPNPPEKCLQNDQELAEEAKRQIFEATGKITNALGGLGLFGCELFVAVRDGKVKVYGNECSPRPHDTGMVTILSHQMGLSEAGLHVRAVCGFPIASTMEGKFRVIKPLKPACSHVLLSPVEGWDPQFTGVKKGMAMEGVSYLFFGKPEAHVNRRLGVALAFGRDALDAKKKAERAAHAIKIRTRHTKYLPQQEKRKHLLKW